jgi:hypothetical protein
MTPEQLKAAEVASLEQSADTLLDMWSAPVLASTVLTARQQKALMDGVTAIRYRQADDVSFCALDIEL